jgi:[acyl-carrier-protein] S-malonyltransferase
MTLALLFPGQGTQHAQMLPWLADEPGAAPLLARLSAALGEDWRDRLSDAAWATDNRVAQTLITGVSLAAWRSLEARLPSPSVIAGYSVGELPAFSAAGVFDAVTALDLAYRRAQAMNASVEGQQTGLLAVSGLRTSAVRPVCERHGLSEAIHLGPDRRVLGGLAAALDRAAVDFLAAGAQCHRLAVQLASHTPWVTRAVAPFAAHLADVAFRPPESFLVCNRTGAAVRDEAALKAALAGQIDHCVCWDACMDALAERRVSCVLEVGPGTTLAKLWNDRGTGVPARSIDEFRSAQAVVQWVMRWVMQ